MNDSGHRSESIITCSPTLMYKKQDFIYSVIFLECISPFLYLSQLCSKGAVFEKHLNADYEPSIGAFLQVRLSLN